MQMCIIFVQKWLMKERARHLILCEIFQSTSGDCKATLRFRSSQQPPSNCRRYCQKLTKPSKFRHLIAVRARARNAAQMAPAVGEAEKSQQRPGPTQIIVARRKRTQACWMRRFAEYGVAFWLMLETSDLLMILWVQYFSKCFLPTIFSNPYILLPNSQFQYLLKSLQSLFIFQSAFFETDLSISLLVASPKWLFTCVWFLTDSRKDVGERWPPKFVVCTTLHLWL